MVLKEFFRSLPESLICSDIFSDLCNTKDIEKPSERIEEVKRWTRFSNKWKRFQRNSSFRWCDGLLWFDILHDFIPWASFRWYFHPVVLNFSRCCAWTNFVPAMHCQTNFIRTIYFFPNQNQMPKKWNACPKSFLNRILLEYSENIAPNFWQFDNLIGFKWLSNR